MYIDKITFTEENRCFEEGFCIDNLRNVNLLVGDQGVGKSSLLGAMGYAAFGDNIKTLVSARVVNRTKLDLSFTEKLKENAPVDVSFFDSETMNPRTNESGDYETGNSEMEGLAHISQLILSKWESHGETMVPIIVDGLSVMQNKIMIYDEPENGFSVRSQYRFVKEIEEAVKRGCQLFISTHSPIIIESQEEVYSLEHRKWMSSKEFLETQKQFD